MDIQDNYAIQLLREIQNVKYPPQFQEDVVNRLRKDISELADQLEDYQKENKSQEQMWYTIANFFYQRQRRILLAYLFHRLVLVKELKYLDIMDEKYKYFFDKLAQHERDYLGTYQNIQASYEQDIGINVIREDLNPPRSLFMEIMCLKDLGNHMIESGTVINFKKGCIYHIPRLDAEPFILRGEMEDLTNKWN